MTRFVSRSLVLFCCAALLMAAGDAPVPPAPPAPKVQLPDLVTKAREARDREIERANTRYRNVLEREKEQATRRGNLEVALAIQAEIEGVGQATEKKTPTVDLTAQSWTRVLSSGQVLTVSFDQEGAVLVNGPSSWKKWARTDEGIIINGNETLRAVPTYVLFSSTPQGSVLLVPSDPTK